MPSAMEKTVALREATQRFGLRGDTREQLLTVAFWAEKLFAELEQARIDRDEAVRKADELEYRANVAEKRHQEREAQVQHVASEARRMMRERDAMGRLVAELRLKLGEADKPFGTMPNA